MVAAFGSLPPNIRNSSYLYLVGRKGNAYPKIRETVERLGLESQVEMLGYVDNQTLAALYRDASIFAYVSEYEGFGLPVVEAMLRGLPVLTSNRSSLPEVAGSAALIVETDVQSISAGLERLLTNEDLRKELSEKGLARAAEFDWATTASRTQRFISGSWVSEMWGATARWRLLKSSKSLGWVQCLGIKKIVRASVIP